MHDASYPRAQARCRDGSVRRASAPGPRFDSRACPFLWGALSSIAWFASAKHAPSLGHFSRTYPGHFSRALKNQSRNSISSRVFVPKRRTSFGGFLSGAPVSKHATTFAWCMHVKPTTTFDNCVHLDLQEGLAIATPRYVKKPLCVLSVSGCDKEWYLQKARDSLLLGVIQPPQCCRPHSDHQSASGRATGWPARSMRRSFHSHPSR